MKFFVGQRVRKVRGLCVGLTGVISAIETVDAWTIGVTVDNGGIGIDWCGKEAMFRSGDQVWAMPSELEPILDSHQPCESEFKESLDRLLEGVEA